MFYFKITTRRRPPGATKMIDHREYLHRRDLGEHVAGLLSRGSTVAVEVKPVSQRAYIAATRPKD